MRENLKNITRRTRMDRIISMARFSPATQR